MTRRGKETDNPVFLLKRKRGGVCIVQVTFVKLALLFQLLHYRAPVTEVTNAAPRVEDHNCLLQTSGWVLSSCLHRQKDCAWFAHCQSSSKCKHTTLCSRPTSQWYESCGSPPPNLSINNAQWRISSAGNRECEKIPTQRHDLVCLCAIVRHRATAAACSGAAVPTVVEGSCGCQQLDLIPLRVWCEFKHGNAMSH